MLTMPKQLEYALMVLGEMHGGAPGELFAARALCAKLDIPFDVVSKALQRMKHAEIVRSVQGKYGGYQVIRDLGKLQLSELAEVVVGPNAIAACLVPGQSCNRSPSCTIRRAVHRLDQRFQQLLADTTILELIG
ncbi:MAG: Rrf2 family transcriptional regulator [Kiritimatiellia bacterium]|jgi:Rrf2 family protein|nr:Rrf2 family transcriptional regulator [Kiritimatiellia bacterium]